MENKNDSHEKKYERLDSTRVYTGIWKLRKII